ncbi:MAG: iron ABC transporter permease [Lentisphaeraceae bacterium]|nr:iron ABC transporter permease [Lentisphaeraceae bacterium]
MSEIVTTTEYGEALSSVQTRKHKTKLIHLGLAVALVCCFSFALIFGSSSTGLKELVGTFMEYIGLESPWTLQDNQKFIITELRLPRALLSIFIGGCLAIGGVAMQGLFRNPLAAPGILGVNSGAALGAAMMIVLGNAILPESLTQYAFYSVPAGAFLCALVITGLIVKVGTVGGRTNIFILLLTGVALQAIIGAVMGLLTYISDDQQLRSLTFWTMGDLGVAGWKELAFIIPILSFCCFMIMRKAGALNLFLLGEAEAHHLGIDVQKLKKSLIIWTALAISLAVSFTGSIGFIGLAAPHLVRLMTGPDHKTLFPGACLMGALILCVSDILSRSVATAEIPVGIITSFIGAPVFLWLLIMQRKGGGSFA